MDITSLVKLNLKYRTSRSNDLLPLLPLYSDVDLGPGVLQPLSRLVVSMGHVRLEVTDIWHDTGMTSSRGAEALSSLLDSLAASVWLKRMNFIFFFYLVLGAYPVLAHGVSLTRC